jgi:hypothetical protein
VAALIPVTVIKLMLKNNLKQLNLAAAIVLVFTLLAYVYLIFQVSGNYLPVLSDEFFYYSNAASFFENNTLSAALTYNGSGSKFFGADAHGIAYPVLNGGIAKLFGWHSLNFLYTNIFFVAASLLITWVQKGISISDKVLISALLLLFPFFVLYGFTFMQESIHIFFAVASSFLLFNISRTGKRSHIAMFVLLIVIAGLFRPLWFFWLIGLLPFAKNKLQRNVFILIFTAGVVASFLYAYYFAEAVPNYFSSLVNVFAGGNIKEGIFSFVKHFAANVYLYLFSTESNLVYLPIKYLVLIAFTIFTIKALKYKAKLHLAIALVGAVNFGLLFCLYDVFGWREIRVLAPFVYFCIPYLATEIKGYFKYFQLAVLVVIFIVSMPLAMQWIKERNGYSGEEIVNHRDAYNLIAQAAGKNSLVLISYIPSDYSLDLVSLPVKNISGAPIKYIVPYYKLKREKYQYVLSEPAAAPVGTLLISNKYYKLEKLAE